MFSSSSARSPRRRRSSLCAATEKITEDIEEWWGVFYRGDKIGYASQTITPKPKGYNLRDHSGAEFESCSAPFSRPRLGLIWKPTKNGFWNDSTSSSSSKEIRFSARGAVHDNKLSLEIDSAGHKSSPRNHPHPGALSARRAQTLRRHPAIGDRQEIFLLHLRSVDLIAAGDDRRHRGPGTNSRRRSHRTGDQIAPKLPRHLGCFLGRRSRVGP